MGLTEGNDALLRDKVGLLTGGAGGIGLALARALGSHGAQVVLADLGTSVDGSGAELGRATTAAAELAREGLSVAGFPVDVVDRDAVESLVSRVVEQFGRLDVVINAAGNLKFEPLLTEGQDTWRRTLDVHVTGAFNVAQSAGRHWSEDGGGGALISMGSEAGFAGVSNAAAYATAKAALVGLTLSCSAVFAEFGATANLLIPQAATRMTDQIPPEDRPDSERWDTGEFEPGNVAPMALYLASDRGRWLNGRIIGGFGYEAHEYSLPSRVRSIFSSGPWKPDELAERVEHAFGKRLT